MLNLAEDRAGALDLRTEATFSLLSAVEALQEAVALDHRGPSLKMHATIAAMHGLCVSIERARGRLDEETLRELLEPALLLHRLSPFVRRLQDWPRGYPGDFETIELLCEARPALAADHPCYWIEWYALNTAIAQQHRNKVAFQQRTIARAMQAARARGEIFRLLSVGCGGARDLLDLPLDATAEVVLLDQDRDALALASRRAASAGRVVTLCRDALHGLRALGSEAFDLILFGGLFDYLSDRSVAALLRLAARRLRPRGSIVFTNLSGNAHYGTFIESMARWPLILRSEAELRALVEQAGLDAKAAGFTLDPTGLSWLATLEGASLRSPARSVLAAEPEGMGRHA